MTGRRVAKVLASVAVFTLLFAYLYWSRLEGIRDLVSGELRVVVSFELESDNTRQLLDKMKFKAGEVGGLKISWMERLSEANVLVVAVKEWSHTLYFKDVKGLSDFAASANGLSKQDHRTIFTINSPDGIVLVVVAYMVPELDTWAFDCIAGNFSEVIIDASRYSEESFAGCLHSPEEQL